MVAALNWLFTGFPLGMAPYVTSLNCNHAQNVWSKHVQDDVLALIDSGGSQGGSEGFHWVLDPIDGTRGFVGMRQYAVCLGLLHKGEVGMCLTHITSC